MDDPLLRPLPARPVAQRARDWLVWFGIGRLVVVACSVAAVGAGGFWLLRAPPTPIESSLPRATSAGATTVSLPMASTPSTGSTVVAAQMPTSTTAAPAVVVHVAGHVAMPGVYTLPPDARVVDAVAIAGGATATAQADAINLAQPLHDGDRVYVPGVDDASGVPAGVTPAAGGTAASPAGGSSVPVGPVDLNTATAEQLDALPGVGPSTAAAIVAHRDVNGPFASVDDLDAVTGIGPTKLAALRSLVTV